VKKEQRLVFRELSSEVETTLCSFCKYSISQGCKDGMECKHPLVDRTCNFPGEEELCPGDDCWGYRPVVKVSDVADIVGIILANGWREWMYVLPEDKSILVSGRKEAGHNGD